MAYQIQRIIPSEDDADPIFEDVEIFEEKPAPHVTLGGHLLALKNENGFEYIAVEIMQLSS